MRLSSKACFILSCLLATSAAGCRGDAPPQAERPSQPETSLQLPADFPADIPLPATYRVNSVSDLGTLLVATLATPEPVPELFAEAGQRMPAQGWQSSAEIRHATGNAMRVYRKGRREVSLSFAPHRGGNDSMVTVQLRDPQRSL
ncbi:hypothetical protein J5837_06875 [Pseudoxanthomonas helianthi]|uniref:Uncharacterized protein n=1 Tax=Pseudoxanthomonas helianthi TaxID=1453541 RepID=A0A941ATK6_9GAMM|nr:hypothetical protein [Pseudoxanthomonas helianthi]MBP3984150.1 hypothetical protein [Pseudoxanthomonas helianthi]